MTIQLTIINVRRPLEGLTGNRWIVRDLVLKEVPADPPVAITRRASHCSTLVTQ